ncbi:hypothetical protein GCM10008018_14890 [Paenibacillus marchantiophytorum]|uniref:Glycine zipper domain-containing protein n=1 Tax=Paenibacillus marchantiophytorum TaxID=1619310 RepID=A0ABQ2BRR5_9BACL|nr:hypothetical protein [Paenibacillus marchantiophytorum]GGI45990.1 hypothetical protein GCM10008018_14890 [Paenibacillus marchantiophytorum]
MSDTVLVGNMAKMMAAQDRLRSMVDRTGASTRRLEDMFGKAAEASAKLSQITARPTIAIRDYFSFVIDRLLLQLADLRHTKVDLKLMLGEDILRNAKQLRDLLKGLGGSLSIDVEAKGAAKASASASASVTMVSVTTKPDTNPIDTWIDRILKIAEAIKALGEAFQAFGAGFKSFAQGIKILKELFTGKGKQPAGDKTKPKAGGKTDPCAKEKTKCKGGDKTKSKSGSKTKCRGGSKTKSKTSDAAPKSKSKGNKAEASAGERARGTPPPAPPATDVIPEGNPAAPQGGRLGKLFKKGAKLLKMGGKVLKPLGIGLSAVDILTSDNKAAAAIQAGSGAAGTALGATIGSFILPGVGTAVGGIVGGWLGDKAGSYINDKLFGSKDTSQDQESKTDLLPAGRESAAADPLQANDSGGNGGSQEAAPPNQYEITVDGITINFPKEEVDEEELALTIGHQIASQINAAIQNRVENGGGAYG